CLRGGGRGRLGQVGGLDGGGGIGLLGCRDGLGGVLVGDAGSSGAGGGLLHRGLALRDGGLCTAAPSLDLLGGGLDLRRAQHHGLLEVGLVASRASGRGLADELQLVFAELDDVVVLQEVLLDLVAVDHGAVGD